jgi:hypothetical protein
MLCRLRYQAQLSIEIARGSSSAVESTPNQPTILQQPLHGHFGTMEAGDFMGPSTRGLQLSDTDPLHLVDPDLPWTPVSLELEHMGAGHAMQEWDVTQFLDFAVPG